MKFMFKTLIAIIFYIFTSNALADNRVEEEADFTKFEDIFNETTHKLNLDYKVTAAKCVTDDIYYCSYHIGNDSILLTKGQKYSKIAASVTVVNGDKNKFLLLALSVAFIIDPSLSTDEVMQIIKGTVLPVTKTQTNKAEVTFNGFKYWATAQGEKVFFYNIILSE
ncbi:hypothetical protein [uncultured Kiloniella sp.]|uniref:hypothetical protein n=1 Tax=uncultured Kiloniella sp. TaxID=1133091 RepID=UPI0026198646|nr:hypothetical protein [uncultured Kiloniella sp.]